MVPGSLGGRRAPTLQAFPHSRRSPSHPGKPTQSCSSADPCWAPTPHHVPSPCALAGSDPLAPILSADSSARPAPEAASTSQAAEGPQEELFPLSGLIYKSSRHRSRLLPARDAIFFGHNVGAWASWCYKLGMIYQQPLSDVKPSPDKGLPCKACMRLGVQAWALAFTVLSQPQETRRFSGSAEPFAETREPGEAAGDQDTPVPPTG